LVEEEERDQKGGRHIDRERKSEDRTTCTAAFASRPV